MTSYQVMLTPGGVSKTTKAKTTTAKFSHLSPTTQYTVTVLAVGAATGAPTTVVVPAAG